MVLPSRFFAVEEERKGIGEDLHEEEAGRGPDTRKRRGRLKRGRVVRCWWGRTTAEVEKMRSHSPRDR
jgi:hypothetical protein